MPIPKGYLLYDSIYITSEKRETVEMQDRLLTAGFDNTEGAAEKGVGGGYDYKGKYKGSYSFDSVQYLKCGGRHTNIHM